jgi:flavin-dependent dehydrogenase
MPDELRGLTPLGPERGADVTWRMAERTAGRGWFLVGDAAATLDPTSSHGVLKALLSGLAAGHLIVASLTGKAPADEIATAYHDWVRDGLRPRQPVCGRSIATSAPLDLLGARVPELLKWVKKRTRGRAL